MRDPALRIFDDELIVDNFAGGGGASLGMEWALGRSPDIAINHDPEAIAMHKANHPGTRHFCEDVWKVDPAEACKGRPVGLAWFSPDCKHFSKAKGGKPVEKKIRGLAWIVVKWAKAVRPRVIILENVEEFADWGPLGPDNKPLPLRKGFTFRRWLGSLRNLGYEIDFCELAACDYGTPTTRNRLYLVARRDGKPIVWPEATHSDGGRTRLIPWRTAAECIDFAIPTYSIFLSKEEGRSHGVKRPLADNTMARIARGMQKFVIGAADPFIVGVGGRMGQSAERGLQRPMQTITAKGDAALVVPYLTEHANGSTQRIFDAAEPLRTQCAQVKGGHFALVAPYLVPRYGEREGQEPRSLSVQRPHPTIVPTQNGGQLVTAFLAKHYGDTGQRPGSGLREPVSTVTASDHNALVASSLIKLKGTSRDGQDLRQPLHTVQANGNHYGEVRAFLTRYNGMSIGQKVAEPISTLDTTDRIGLVTVHGEPYVVADIGMRMLAPRELYRAQGFPDSYLIDFEFEGRRLPKDAQVRMCGNSVCPPVAAAIARAQFEERAIEIVA